MELAKKLEAQGWHLTEEGIKTLTAAVGSEDPRKIIDEALNRDMRDIGGGALPIKREDVSATMAGQIVLQVQRVRNIAAPKSNEESKAAPRLLQLELSDGQNYIQALELEPVPSLSLNVAPGTKVYFRAEQLQLVQGYMLLRSNDLQLLGGRVEALYEKWDLARTMLKYARSGRPLSGASAPPPWMAFGKKVDITADRNFKSLAPAGDKDKPTKENEEFNAMRSEAIAVASKAGVKKVFGGGGQNIVDHNIKKILDKGYSEEEAKVALQATRNNLERALYNLKRRRDASTNAEAPPLRGGRGDRGGREGKRGASLKDEAEAAKPAANATLFDFLTNKLHATETPVTMVSSPAASTSTANNIHNYNNNTSKPFNARGVEAERRSSAANVTSASKTQTPNERGRFENNISSSFAANRGGHSGRGGSARNRGGGREDRAPRGDRAGAFNERGSTNERGGVTSRNKEQSNNHQTAKNRNANEHPGSKALADPKAEQDTAPAKDQFNNRRNSERQSNRGSAPRGENGHAANNNNGNNNNRRRQQGNAPAAGAKSGNSNEEFNARMTKVVEETAKLKLSANKREDRRNGRQGAGGGGAAAGAPAGGQLNRQQFEQQQHLNTQKSERAANAQRQQQQNSRQQTNTAPNYSQLANGYTYDPSKIMGFQSKETNEFAMSLLKSQGVNIAPGSQQQQQKQQQQQHQQQANNYYAAQSPPTFMMSNAQPVPLQAPPQQFGMLPGDGWLWNIGDLCMAKYWDDGRYYEAEITAVSENTCVVFYLGYGNHEEVLKSDILPLTDAQNRPLSNMPQQQQSRYRSDRQGQQMYIPPHKRDH